MRTFIAYSVLATGLLCLANTLNPAISDGAALPSFSLLEDARALPNEDLFRGPEDRLTAFSPMTPLEVPQETAILLPAGEGLIEAFSTKLAGILAPADPSEDAQAASAPVLLADASASQADIPVWRTAVLVEPSGQGPNGKQAAAHYFGGEARRTLVTEIQTELVRTGCYEGAADGTWSAETRAAMASFLKRVNAKLPMEEPDFVLLTLVRSQSSGTCALECPSGEVLTSERQCIPASILAQANKPRRTTVVASANASEQPSRAPDFSGRMGIGGPRTVEQRVASLTVTSGSDRYAVASGESDGMRTRGTAETRAPRIEKASVSESPAQRPKERRSGPTRQAAHSGSYRAVRHLFENPLGRL